MRPVHVLTSGDFGRAVAGRMGEFLEIVTSDADGQGALPASWPLARLHIFVSWRPAPAIARNMNASAFAWRVPWLPIVVQHPSVYLGPSVIPGFGPCYACFRRRLAQHSGSNELSDVLEAHYENDSSAGPQGYLPSVATFIASMACHIAELILQNPADEAGNVRQFDILSLRTWQSHVVGVHGCEHCGSGCDERTRSHEELKKDLARLFPGPP